MVPENHFILNIEPFRGAAPIHFGMHKQDVAHAFTHVYSSFFKTEKMAFRSDHNEYVGFISHYADTGLVDFIEIFPRPQYTNTKVFFRNVDITEFSIKAGHKLFSETSKNFTKDSYGYFFHDLGISIYKQDLENEEELIEVISLAPRKDYWKME